MQKSSPLSHASACYSEQISVKGITIITLEGKEVLRKSFDLTTGNTIAVDLEGVASGIYIINFNSNKHPEPQKLMIVK